jgi:hypothetical protein
VQYPSTHAMPSQHGAVSSLHGHESRRHVPSSHWSHGAQTKPSQQSPVVRPSQGPSNSEQ